MISKTVTSVGLSHIPYSVVVHVVFLINVTFAADAALQVTCLRCDYLSDPIGIDSLRPQLSWVPTSNRRGINQSAYQVLVASSPDLLASDHADLWDSGKVKSDNTTAITYQGSLLSSGQRCYWKVRIWDQGGSSSEWSDVGSWSMGLLHSDDWEAQWIGYDAERVTETSEAPLEGAKWICHPEDQPGQSRKGHRLFLRMLDLPEGDKIKAAEVLAIADDKFWMAINNQVIIHDASGWKEVKPVDISSILRLGKNQIRFNVRNEAKGPTGLLFRLSVRMDSGREITLVSDGSTRGYKTPGKHWSTETLSEKELRDCREIGAYGCEPWGKAQVQRLFLPPVPIFRDEFQISKPVELATLHATALGICDAHLNGTRVSEEHFTPGWTDYTKRVYYRSYDVTHLIRPGVNALGGKLADGWYSGYIGWGRNRNHYGTKPRLRLQLNLQYEDGTTEVFGTCEAWKAIAGPTREADFLMGEKFDARLASDGWDEPGFDDEKWDAVSVGAEVAPAIQSHPGPPVIAVEELKPVTITKPLPDVYVFDLGQNFAGVVRLKVRGKPGQEIKIRFAERLNADGTLYTTNLRGARTIDTYICRGNGVEVWQPRFTFHGFQYVEVAGLKSPPQQDTITGMALSSATPRTGWFECSDPMLNRLHENTRWTQLANFIDVPTDCPQRDERLGWTGDAQVYIATACLNADVQAFFRKWLVDLVDAQRADGQFPMVAPLRVAGDDGGPAWADAGVICPWTIYEVYGDRQQLEEHYDAMKQFVKFCRNRSTDQLLPPREFHCFGDWLNIKANTPKEVIYSAYFAHSATLLSRSAEVLGRTEDANRYAKLFDQVKEAFNTTYVDNSGRIHGETQCCYVLALAYDLLDAERQQQAVEHLVADIEKRGMHLSTGFVGTKDLMLVLSKIGRNDVAYRLLRNDTFPSWGFSIKHGATSIWERWDGWTPENGFQDPGMNSFAHYSFGAVYQWIVENIGGIRRVEPAYKRFIIAPQLGGGLSWAKTDYESIRGRISSHWKREGNSLCLDVTVPANTSAEIHLPTANLERILESGQPVARALGVRELHGKDSKTIVGVGSGKYSFSVELPH